MFSLQAKVFQHVERERLRSRRKYDLDEKDVRNKIFLLVGEQQQVLAARLPLRN